ncbi:helix-turn-helix transcriptional regulator [Brevundimonas nasdae]|uniref:AlpA family phage regulatory protein n=1 Tax=Brevundimonas nasdae TaxID=172043 RepID=A0ACD4VPL4_9CAUL|nr:AlpA family phage regulatory protein [Brevundimonas nasdae]WOB79897.1 AlpA family phage regulatory protein [Brevundimonas nasdae]
MGRTHSPLPRTIKKPELRQMVPLADSTIWEMEQRGEFPKRFRLTPRCVVWDLSEVQSWLEKRRRTPVTPAKAPDVRLRRSRPVHDAPGASQPQQ